MAVAERYIPRLRKKYEEEVATETDGEIWI